jgi:hypothetical protein
MNPIIISETAAWGCSGLRADDFLDLVAALVDSGHVVRSRRDLVVRNLKTLAILIGSGRPRRRSRRGAR